MESIERVDPATGEVLAVAGAMPAAIAEAIIAVCKRVRVLGGDSRNEHQKYNYVSIDKFLETLGPPMAEAGLVLIQDEVMSDVRGQGDKPWLFVRYAFGLAHISGAQWGPVYRSVALQITGPQTYGSAESYMLKRFIRGVFLVPTGEQDADADPQTATPPARGTAAPQSQQRTQRPAQTPAAPPDASRDEARDRYRAIQTAIDEASDPGDLDALLLSPAWAAMKAAVLKATPGETGEGAIAKLERRAYDRKGALAGDTYGSEP